MDPSFGRRVADQLDAEGDAGENPLRVEAGEAGHTACRRAVAPGGGVAAAAHVGGADVSCSIGLEGVARREGGYCIA